jgi:hypothetical protein
MSVEHILRIWMCVTDRQTVLKEPTKALTTKKGPTTHETAHRKCIKMLI